MTKPQDNAVFSTIRSANPTDLPAMKYDKPHAVVISQTPGLAEIIARGMNAAGDTQSSHLVMSLPEFAETPNLSLEELSICLFEIEQGNDAQIAAIRKLSEMGAGTTKILGVTSEVLNLATARTLIDAGVEDVIPLGTVTPQLDQAASLPKALDVAEAQTTKSLQNGVIIGVAQTRGGIGATTYALNLATLLSKKPKQKRKAAPLPDPRVAILDLDLQNGTLGASIDADESPEYVNMLRNGTVVDEELLRKLMVTHKAGFDVLGAPIEFVPLNSMRPDMMAALLDTLRLTYDYIVLDMPRTMVEWLDPVLARADKMYVISDTAVHSIRQARRMIDFYSEDHVSLPIEVCVSLERKPFSTSAAVKEAEKFLDRKLTHWLPRDDKAAKLSTDLGEPLLVAKPKSAVSKAMKPVISDLLAIAAIPQRREA